MLLSEVHSISILVKIGVFFKTNHLPALGLKTIDFLHSTLDIIQRKEHNQRIMPPALNQYNGQTLSRDIYKPISAPGPRMAGSRG